jgi:nicotinate-nucleotide adenylyltransferase
VKVGLLGGTFDPPHLGHLIVAQDAALALELDRIVFIPAAHPPHKQQLVVTAPAIRARMLELAIAGNAGFGIERLELDRDGASYTVDTLRQLRQRDPATEWVLLIGADQYREFGTWREPEQIRRLATVAVLTRAGSEVASSVQLRDAAGAQRDVRVEVTRVDISSTMVRARVAAGLPIRYLVPDRVEEFILEQRLYSRNGSEVAGYDPGHTDIRG